jgi:hypothetical protein
MSDDTLWMCPLCDTANDCYAVTCRHCGWVLHESEDIDACPETGEVDCLRCSGAYCGVHMTEPCECDTAERHRNYYDESEVEDEA